ncbi:PatA/PatG family cyanobactin maturation protease [Streptomyces goshikiensis]|uniref:PatA/PatG family cyanobactin maturation protease n=1 Tax=Streptomyces goshikiensis TaxID=1942 RepID=UPI0036AB30B8
MANIWQLTVGDGRISVAMVDSPVDETHPAFEGVRLIQVSDTMLDGGSVEQQMGHGTAVASVLFGNHASPVPGVAPGCRAVSVPAFADGRRASQLDLARAIDRAVDAGVHVINISGGQLAGEAEAEDLLVRAVNRCHERGVLVVAAAGNDGCFCDHVPASMDGVLAVGACDANGLPLGTSNFGPGIIRQGILAPGQDLLVAVPGGGTSRMSGTSLAAPVVAGVAALLLSLQLRQGCTPDPLAVGRLLLATADPCIGVDVSCVRHLKGMLNIKKAVDLVLNSSSIESVSVSSAESVVTSCDETAGGPAECGCDVREVGVSGPSDSFEIGSPATVTPPFLAGQQSAYDAKDADVFVSAEEPRPAVRRLVYALGTLGYDFGTEARRDTFKQLMPEVTVEGAPLPANPYDPVQMVSYLRAMPSEAQPLIWTLNLDLTPIYAIKPTSGYAPGVYARLVDFLDRQLKAESDCNYIDRISVPGTLSGRTVRLFNGQVVPVIDIDLTRGLYGWSLASLAQSDNPTGSELAEAVAEFLQRIYYDLRNFGATSHDRALNFAATNIIQARQTLVEALGREMALKEIDVVKSPYGRPGSDCWDVKMRFFNRENSRKAKRVYRFTIDVTDVMPVTLGPVRSWPEA